MEPPNHAPHQPSLRSRATHAARRLGRHAAQLPGVPRSWIVVAADDGRPRSRRDVHRLSRASRPVAFRGELTVCDVSPAARTRGGTQREHHRRVSKAAVAWRAGLPHESRYPCRSLGRDVRDMPLSRELRALSSERGHAAADRRVGHRRARRPPPAGQAAGLPRTAESPTAGFCDVARRLGARERPNVRDLSRATELSCVSHRLTRLAHDRRAAARGVRAWARRAASTPTCGTAAAMAHRVRGGAAVQSRRPGDSGCRHAAPVAVARAGRQRFRACGARASLGFRSHARPCRGEWASRLRGLPSGAFLLELSPERRRAALPPVQLCLAARQRGICARDEVRLVPQHRGVLPLVSSRRRNRRRFETAIGCGARQPTALAAPTWRSRATRNAELRIMPSANGLHAVPFRDRRPRQPPRPRFRREENAKEKPDALFILPHRGSAALRAHDRRAARLALRARPARAPASSTDRLAWRYHSVGREA